MSSFFMTATGTDIGKTYVTAGLLRHLVAAGHSVAALKPVVSGFDMHAAEESDPGQLLAAMGRAVTPGNVSTISPWRFAAPLSPDMAASREGKSIPFHELVAFCRSEIGRDRQRVLFIEGVGGVMVPLDESHTVLDWMAELATPVVLVAGSYLGTLSHTLSALEVLIARKLVVAAIVVNETRASTVPLDETVGALQKFARGTPIAVVRRRDTLTNHGDDFAQTWSLIG